MFTNLHCNVNLNIPSSTTWHSPLQKEKITVRDRATRELESSNVIDTQFRNRDRGVLAIKVQFYNLIYAFLLAPVISAVRRDFLESKMSQKNVRSRSQELRMQYFINYAAEINPAPNALIASTPISPPIDSWYGKTYVARCRP